MKHDSNLQKMRLLTFMQMAEGRTEISFDTIQKEMDLQEDEVESFIIDGGYFAVSVLNLVIRILNKDLAPVL